VIIFPFIWKVMFFAALAIKCSGWGDACKGQQLETQQHPTLCELPPKCLLKVDAIRPKKKKSQKLAHILLCHLTTPTPCLGFTDKVTVLLSFSTGNFSAFGPEPSSLCILLKKVAGH
jgi:hypothetical protein